MANRMLIRPTSALGKNFNTRDTICMSVVKIFPCLEFGFEEELVLTKLAILYSLLREIVSKIKCKRIKKYAETG